MKSLCVLGKTLATKTDGFSERFQMAFDPPPKFQKIIWLLLPCKGKGHISFVIFPQRTFSAQFVFHIKYTVCCHGFLPLNLKLLGMTEFSPWTPSTPSATNMRYGKRQICDKYEVWKAAACQFSGKWHLLRNVYYCCSNFCSTSAPESVLLPLINHLADKYTSEPDEENGIKNKSKERLNLLKQNCYLW